MARKTKHKPQPVAAKPVESPSASPAPSIQLWRIAAFVVLGLAGYGAYYLWSEAAVEKQFKQINSALERYDYDDAADLIETLLRNRPTDSSALLLAAQTARRRGHFETAETHLRKAMREEALPEAIDGEKELLLVQRGDLSRAEPLKRFCEAMHGEPQVVLSLEAIFEGSLRSLKPNAAKWAADRWSAVRTNPRDVAMHKVWVGRLHEYAEDTPVAIMSLRESVRLAPDFRIARVKLAELLVGENPTEATEHIDWLVQRRPNDPATLLLLARKHRATGDPGKASEILDGILKSDPDNVTALIERGRVAMETQHAADAEGFLRRAFQSAPERRAVRLALADCLRVVGKTEEAAEHRKALQAIDERLEKTLRELNQPKASP